MPEIRANALPSGIRDMYTFNGYTINMPNIGAGERDVNMHYIDEGEGPVVLMLHGNPTWSFFFRNLIKEICALGYRCIVPDHIGCGLSDKPQNYSYTLDRRILDIEHLIDHLEIKKFSLVVHDWGGAIGCGTVVRRPELLDKLVLLNTAAYTSKRIPFRIASVRIPVIGEFMVRGLNAFAYPATYMAVVKPLSKGIREGYLWPYRTWGDRVAIWNFVKDIPLHKTHCSYKILDDIEKKLPLLASKPIQIVWGGLDFCFNDSFYKRWLKIFPEALTHYYPDCGHYILEDGGIGVSGNISKFITSSPSDLGI